MDEEGYEVSLNVYDLSQGLAKQLSTAFLGKAIEGIWHTGLVVYGNEYFFGGGIQSSPVGTTPYGTPRRVVELGVTHVPKDVFESYLQEIDHRYTAETYSLLSHNCNNFTNEVAQFLVGATIPDDILNLPNEVMNSPMGALMFPMIQQLEATLKAGAVPQAPQFNASALSNSVQKASSVVNKPSNPPSNIPLSSKNGVENKLEAESLQKKHDLPTVMAKPKASDNGVVGDPLGAARNKVQSEIAREFDALMATGTLCASEAAALATRRVMQKYGK